MTRRWRLTCLHGPPRALHPTHRPPITEEEDREGWGNGPERGRVTGGVEEVRVEESKNRKEDVLTKRP